MNIALIQHDIVWEKPQNNREYLDTRLQSCKDCDLIVLPEMFTTGFSMNTKNIAEKSFGDSYQWMKEKANELDAVLMGSISVFENKNIITDFILLVKGNPHFYDKKHLFTMAKEHLHYSAGEKGLIVNVKDWKIKPLICYDLRFPLWSRNKCDKGNYSFDALVYVAN